MATMQTWTVFAKLITEAGVEVSALRARFLAKLEDTRTEQRMLGFVADRIVQALALIQTEQELEVEACRLMLERGEV